jgi:hypothetical protein
MGLVGDLGFAIRRALFGDAEQGMWYDLNDLSTLFTDSAGTTPATWGDPIGLLLDKHESDGRGVVNRLIRTQEFNLTWSVNRVSVTANTTVAPDGTTTADTVTADGTAGAYWVKQFASATGTNTTSVYVKAGTQAIVQISYEGDTTSFVNFDVTNGAPVVGTSAGTVTGSIVDVGSGWYRCIAVNTTSVTGVTIGMVPLITSPRQTGSSLTTNYFLWGAQLELGSTATAYQANGGLVGGNGNHRIQSTAGSRPILGRMPKRGRVNLLVSTQDVSAAAFGKTAITTPNTNTIVETTASSDHLLNQSFATVVSGQAYTKTVSLQKGSLATAPDFMQLSMASARFGATQFATVNVSTGAVINTAGGATCTALGADPDNAGAWLFSYTATATSSGAGALLVVLFCNNNSAAARSPSYVGAITADCRVYKVQTEEGATATNYQHVIDSLGFNVTESGQTSCGYLSYNGSNQWMQTAAAVNFSATDEMSVFAGVRKAVDTPSANLVEHTVSSDANNGAFAIFIPTGLAVQAFNARSRGTVISANALANSFPSLTSAVLSTLFKISTDSSTTRVNGAFVQSSATDQGTGNYANAVTYFGARAGTSSFFNGLEFSSIIRGALTSGTLLTRTEQYVARQTPTVNL